MFFVWQLEALYDIHGHTPNFRTWLNPTSATAAAAAAIRRAALARPFVENQDSD
jgi:hypothetical protein